MPEQNNPLAALKDIILPSQLETGLPAVGWWLVAGLSLVVLALLLFISWRYWTLTSTRRTALRELKSYPSIDLVQLNILMKRVALSYFPRHQVASLTGQAWLAFLDSKLTRAPGKFTALEAEWQRQLYTAETIALEPATLHLCEYWLKHVAPPLSWATLLTGKISPPLGITNQASRKEASNV
ncbi:MULTISPECIES: DUF4381 domain-containing protein [unclassified Agarivorans]|uniref:DUF4381 domain-containing protein n=1 Tax=unclassified Agarivorans TaxID=2636026 RepID=UPI003D7C9843